jgi:hypothetical protein
MARHRQRDEKAIGVKPPQSTIILGGTPKM